ncbi:uncharacterized protein LOC120255245 [Dioscorea cayenensis subsp. rotundata]|uniref:Uncharacterized protein LOC120255245 n=1 Tax=Dioscorea cayennensis subsp. rotundata TaxID=55577 RepID=A0AB40AVN8_DIOCR|nr:uncharacterized protein LOC120255245 [Dioscorea cayenensis subsp. rotundata]XP_039119045.1 uncharacterized protein LOC120255245 [Dioscorea cayenensis subsp. rotundata]
MDGDSSANNRWQRSQLSISLTEETSKLKKELAKIIVIDTVSGQTSDEILLEFLPGALNTPRVDAVYEFRGSSFLASLSSEAEVIKASKIGELSLPSKMEPCVLSFKPWSAEIGSVGSASSKAQVLLIWNLPLHAWTWSVLVDVLRPIGELVAIPQPSKPCKSFLSVLVRCRPRVMLPHELILSFGMRKFIVLITNNHFPFLTFQRDLEKYIYLPSRSDDGEVRITSSNDRLSAALSREDKEKAKMEAPIPVDVPPDMKNPKLDTTSRPHSQIWRPRTRPQPARMESSALGASTNFSNQARPESAAPGAPQKTVETWPASNAPGVSAHRREELGITVQNHFGPMVLHCCEETKMTVFYLMDYLNCMP